MDVKEFIKSGMTIITDTLAPKSQPIKAPKSMTTDAPSGPSKDPMVNLVKRCKEEKPPKKDVIVEFLKVIEREEALI